MPQVKVSAPIALSNVKSVFGSTTLYGLRRGGSYVPAIANAYGAVSTTNPALLSFAGLYYPPVDLPSSIGQNDFAISPTNATVTVNIYNTGLYDGYQGGTQNMSGTWKLAGHAADYEIRYTKTSGTTPGGSAVNTWINLVSGAGWSLSEPTNGYASKACGGTLELRMAASPFTVFDSCTMNFEVTVEV